MHNLLAKRRGALWTKLYTLHYNTDIMIGTGNLKRKSKEVLDIFMSQPTDKKNLTKAYMQVHPNAAPNTAQSAGSALLNSPAGMIYTGEQVAKAKRTIVQLMDSEKDEIRLRAAQDVQDRTTGKAVQQVVQSTSGITLALDLSGSTVTINPSQDK